MSEKRVSTWVKTVSSRISPRRKPCSSSSMVLTWVERFPPDWKHFHLGGNVFTQLETHVMQEASSSFRWTDWWWTATCTCKKFSNFTEEKVRDTLYGSDVEFHVTFHHPRFSSTFCTVKRKPGFYHHVSFHLKKVSNFKKIKECLIWATIMLGFLPSVRSLYCTELEYLMVMRIQRKNTKQTCPELNIQ